MKKILSSLMLFAFIGLSAIAQQWTVKTPMTTPRQGCGVAVVNNIIYVIGGGGDAASVKTVEAYDPSLDLWTTKASMSVARGELGVAVANGKIYAIGGYNTTAVNTVEEYNPITNTWTTKTPMSSARSVLSVGVINNKIYVVGGWPGNIATLEEYNPATDSWSTKTACSIGRQQINGCAVLDDKLFFISGKDSWNTTYYKINESYDPTSNTWTSQTDIPEGRFAGASTVLNNEIHYLGGSTPTYGSNTPNFNNHYVYSTLTNSWKNDLVMLNKRSRQIAATVNNKIYVIGGQDSTGKVVGWNEEYSTTAPCINTINITVTDTLIINANITGYYPVIYQNNIKVYPNPTNDAITIDCGSNYSTLNGYTIKITNSLSQTVYTSLINKQTATIDLNSWTGKGIYFVHLIDASSNTIEIKKIVLQ